MQHSADTHQAGPNASASDNRLALDLPQTPDGRSKLLFILAGLLFLAWVAFLAVLAVISGKRPETRAKEGGRSASRSINDRRSPPEHRPALGYSPSEAGDPAATASA